MLMVPSCVGAAITNSHGLCFPTSTHVSSATVQTICCSFMLFVKCARLVIVRALRTANTGDDCGQKYQG